MTTNFAEPSTTAPESVLRLEVLVGLYNRYQFRTLKSLKERGNEVK